MARSRFCVEVLEQRSLLSGTTGLPDQTFGIGGDARVNTPGVEGPVIQAITSPDDSVYYLSFIPGSSGSSARQFEQVPSALAITKVLTTGVLDTTWGVGGRFTITLNGGLGQEAKLLLLPSGNLLLGGSVSSPDFLSSDLFLARITPLGAIDFTFAGSSGFAIFDAVNDFGGATSAKSESLVDMVLSGTNKLVLLSQDLSQSKSYLLRLNLDTTAPDTTFGGGDGAVDVAPQLPDPSAAIRGNLTVDTSSRIYFSIQGSAHALVRFDATGTRDTSFLLSSPDVRGAISSVEVGGALYIAHANASSGTVADEISVFKVDFAGNPDSGFGNAGFLSIPLASAEDVQLVPGTGGTVVLTAVSALNANGISVQRFTSTGIDTSYNNGLLTLLPVPSFDRLRSVVRSGDRVTAIATFTPPDPSNKPTKVYAFDANGSPDFSFNFGSTLTVNPNAGGAGEFQSILPRADGGFIALVAENDLTLGSNFGAPTISVVNISPTGAIESKSLLVGLGTASSRFQPSFAKLLPLGDGTFAAVLGGQTGDHLCVHRINAAGAVGQLIVPPSSYGPNPVEFTDVVFDPSTGAFTIVARILSATDKGLVLQFTPNGSIVTSFGSNGFFQFPSIEPGAVAVLPNGVVLVACKDNVNQTAITLVAFGPTGAFSPDYNGGSPQVLNLGFTPSADRSLFPRVIVRLNDGRIALGGTVVRTDSAVIPSVERFSYFTTVLSATGIPDNSFGNSGTFVAPRESAISSEIFDIAQDPNGGLIVVGAVDGAGLLLRLTAAGTIDSNYSAGGDTGSTSSFDRFLSVTVDADGRATVAGADAPLGRVQRQAVALRVTSSASILPPGAFINLPSTPAAGATFYRFTVDYAASSPRTIDSSGFDNSDITVLFPDNSSATASFVSFTGTGSLLTATYELGAPTGGFTSGLYTFTLNANQVFDSANTASPAQTLGSIQFNIPSSAVLSITGIVVPPANIVAGSLLTFSLTVGNTSAVSSPATTVLVFLETLDGNLSFSLGSLPVPSIDGDGLVTVLSDSSTVIPPQTVLTAGTYKIRATLPAPFSSTLASPGLLTFIPPPPVVGGLDTTFGNGTGEVVQVVNNVVITTTATVNLPGAVLLSAGFTSTGDLVVFRTLANGLLDPAFGDNGSGRVTLDIRGTFDAATALAVDASGNILVVGYSLDGSDANTSGATAFVARFSPTGQRDASFAANGVSLLSTLFPANVTTPRVILLDNAGRIYLVGTTKPVAGTDADARAFIIRASAADGSPDTTYATAGALTANTATASSFNTALLLPTGNILAAGSVANTDGSTRPLILRFFPTGLEDTRFTKRLKLTTPAGFSDRLTTFTLMPAGMRPRDAIYIGGTRSNLEGTASSAIVFRLTSAGAVDRSFGRGVIALPTANANLATVSSVVVQAEGRVLVSITTASSSAAFQAGRFGVTIVRRDARGNVDPFFNGGQPLVVAAVPVETAAAQPVVDAFDDFASTRQGQANLIPGGGIRALASRPAGSGTEIRITSLTADGVDFSTLLTATRLPATVAQGFRGTASLLVSNRGSLGSRGSFSVTLIATPLAGGTPITLRALTQSRAIKAGTFFRIALPIQLAKTFATGSYAISSSVTPNFTELTTTNNSSTLANPIAVTDLRVR